MGKTEVAGAVDLSDKIITETATPTMSASIMSKTSVDSSSRKPSLSARRRSSIAANKQSGRNSIAHKSTPTNSTISTHADSRDSRSNGKPDHDPELPEEEEEEDDDDENVMPDSKERSREKNKVAAAKCRAKKRENMEVIESSHRTLSAENAYLRKHEQQLRATVAELRTLALDHQHCNCGVHQYNMIQAGNLARGLGDLHMQHFGGGSCIHSSETLTSEPRSSLHQSPANETNDTNSSLSHDLDQMEQLKQIDQLDFDMDMVPDNLFDLQTPMDPFFAEYNTSNEYTQGL